MAASGGYQRLRAAASVLALVGLLGAVPGIANESKSEPAAAFLVVATLEAGLWAVGLAVIVHRMINRGGLLATGRGGWLWNASQFLIVPGFGIAGIVLTARRGVSFYLVVSAIVIGLIGLAAWTHLYAVTAAKDLS